MLSINQDQAGAPKAISISRIDNFVSREMRGAADKLAEASGKLTSKVGDIKPMEEASGVVFEKRSKFAALPAASVRQSLTGAENIDAGLPGGTSIAQTRIRDVDMAQETMERTKLAILTQATTAMLAQANSMPHQVLQLIGR